MCSPVSATRPAVNEEVRLFRWRHPDRPLIPVLVDGTYPANLSPALRFEVTSEGIVTDRPLTILGPDLRKTGDGKTLALAKVVAGLTGLSPDDIFRRAERVRRHQTRVRIVVASTIVLVASAATYYGWTTYQQRTVIAQQGEIVAVVDDILAKYGAAPEAVSAGSDQRQQLAAALTAIAEGAMTDRRYAQALELIKAGKPKEAEPLLKAVADEKSNRAARDAKDAAAAYRNLGAIAGRSDPKRARDAYGKALELDGKDLEASIGMDF